MNFFEFINKHAASSLVANKKPTLKEWALKICEQACSLQLKADYLTSTESFRSASTRIRPQFSQTITFLRNLISLCF